MKLFVALTALLGLAGPALADSKIIELDTEEKLVKVLKRHDTITNDLSAIALVKGRIKVLKGRITLDEFVEDEEWPMCRIGIILTYRQELEANGPVNYTYIRNMSPNGNCPDNLDDWILHRTK